MKPEILAAAVAAGHLDWGGHGRRLRADACPRCQRMIVTGLDGDVAAMLAVADPEPLDALGELRALLDGCETYEARQALGGRLELDHRDQWRVEGNPPGSFAGDVLAGHRCGRVNYAGLPSVVEKILRPIARASGNPPF